MLADLLSERYTADLEESWENERTATPVRAFAVRVHAAGCSLRETAATLLCSTLLISESRFDGMFKRFSSGFAVEFSSELERPKILCKAIF